MTNTVDFTAKDICAIIKTCSQHDVKDFKMGNLEFSLRHKAPDANYELNLDYERIVEDGPELPEPQVELTKEQKQELAYAERQEMLAVNPVAYEQMIVDEATQPDEDY
jgi:hypothetical protein